MVQTSTPSNSNYGSAYLNYLYSGLTGLTPTTNSSSNIYNVSSANSSIFNNYVTKYSGFLSSGQFLSADQQASYQEQSTLQTQQQELLNSLIESFVGDSEDDEFSTDYLEEIFSMFDIDLEDLDLDSLFE